MIPKNLFETRIFGFVDKAINTGSDQFRKSKYLDHVRVEQHRAAISGSPVSTVILSFRKPQTWARVNKHLVDLKKQLRETDAVYLIDNTTIGIILVDTGSAGAEKLAAKITAKFGHLHFSVGIDTHGGHRTQAPQPYERFLLDSAGAAHNEALTVLPYGRFMDQVRNEKRRTDRSKAPFSVVFFGSSGGAGRSDLDEAQAILGLLTGHRSPVTALGRIDGSTVGVILPHTDAASALQLKQEIEAGSSTGRYAIGLTTYPDHVLEPNTRLDIEAAAVPNHLVGGHLTPQHRVQAAAKRAVDIVGALVGLAVFSPVMLVTAAAVKLSSPGPIIFKQTRIGEKGERFSFYKFRSMRTDADDRIHREYVKSLIEGNHQQLDQGENAKPLYKMKSDPRITRVGRIIRKTSIDELPQFFNVLKGDMSLVGPRPPLPYEVEQYQSWHLRRVLDVKPGITGLWQVDGRSKTSFDDMVRLDLKYSKSWSLTLDFQIMLKTFRAVVESSGAC